MQSDALFASVGIPAVNIGDGDAENLLQLTMVASDDRFLATVDRPPGWFVVSISFDSLVFGARSGQGFRYLSTTRGHGDSSTACENKVIDGFFEVAIAAASVGRFHTVVHPVKSLLCSFTLATRVCVRHTVTWSSLSTTRLGYSLLLTSKIAFLCASSAVWYTVSLRRTTTHTNWTSTSAVLPSLPRYASPRRASPVRSRSQ